MSCQLYTFSIYYIMWGLWRSYIYIYIYVCIHNQVESVALSARPTYLDPHVVTVKAAIDNRLEVLMTYNSHIVLREREFRESMIMLYHASHVVIY
jgi:hypothetical protein